MAVKAFVQSVAPLLCLNVSELERDLWAGVYGRGIVENQNRTFLSRPFLPCYAQKTRGRKCLDIGTIIQELFT